MTAAAPFTPYDGAGAPRLSVCILLAPDFTLSAFSLFVDHLRLAADEEDRSRQINCRWTVIGAGGGPVRSSCGVAVTVERPPADPAAFDYVAVVGGRLYGDTPVDPASVAFLRRAAAAGVPLIGLCTGPFILVRAGLMRGRRCCVSWYHHGDFVSEFPDHRPVSDQLFVVDGDRITCSGGLGVADMAAYLIQRHLGLALARKSGHIMLYGTPRAASEVQPHPPLAARIDDPRVRRALIMMEQNLAEPLSVEEIAARLKTSRRQIERLFAIGFGAGPAEVYLGMRLDYARFLIRTSAQSLAGVMAATGFECASHFARRYRRAFGRTPSSDRASCSAGDMPCLAGHRLFDPATPSDAGMLRVAPARPGRRI